MPTLVNIDRKLQGIIPENFARYGYENGHIYMFRVKEYLQSKGWRFPKGQTRRNNRFFRKGEPIRLDHSNIWLLLGGINQFGREVDLMHRGNQSVDDKVNYIEKWTERKPKLEKDLVGEKYESEQDKKLVARMNEAAAKMKRKEEREKDKEFFDALWGSL